MKHAMPTRCWLTPLCLALVLAGCASTVHRDAMQQIDAGRYEEGLAQLQSGVQSNPGDPQLRASLALQQERVQSVLLTQADGARLAGDQARAGALYQRVLGIAPNHVRALEGLRLLDQRRLLVDLLRQAQSAMRRGDMEQAEKQLVSVLALDARHPEALALRQEIETQRARASNPYPQLRSKIARPVTLEFRDANLKMVLDVLARATGINIIVDKDVKPDLRVSIFVRQVPVEDALDLLLAQSQLERKIVSDNTVVVYPSTPAKIKEHQDWAIRTFFVTNMEVKQAQNLIKTMLKTKDVFIDEKLNILTMRDTPDAIRLAEKLLLAQDQPEPEVVLEVELLDVSRDRFLDLGITWPSTLTLLAPGGAAVSLLSDLRGNINSQRLGVDRTLQARARATNNDINTLASPRIRVRNREKAKIHIGDRIPLVSATSVPSTQGPVITETVQYLDTGIKLEVEPIVYRDDEVSIKVALEVSDSQDAGRTNNGTSLVRVKTSNATTVLRIRDGETQILAGLIRNDQTSHGDKVPGLGDIPIAGRLFGKHDDSWSKRELVLSITPRIVRNMPYIPPHMLEYTSGTEAALRARPLSLQASGEAVNLSAPAGAAQTRSGPVVAPSARSAAPATGAASLQLALDGERTLKVGEEAVLLLRLKADQPLASTALQLGYDPKAIKILEVTEGPLMRQNDAQTTFSTRMDETAGRIFVGLSRAGPQGASGEGVLLQLRVQGLAPASSVPLQVTVFSGIGPGNTPLSVLLPPPLDLSVEP